MDVVVREHDILYSEDAVSHLIGTDSIEAGLDKYVSDVVTTVYGERLLAQIFRLNKETFTNKDVQLTFRVGARSTEPVFSLGKMRASLNLVEREQPKGPSVESPQTNIRLSMRELSELCVVNLWHMPKACTKNQSLR